VDHIFLIPFFRNSCPCSIIELDIGFALRLELSQVLRLVMLQEKFFQIDRPQSREKFKINSADGEIMPKIIHILLGIMKGNIVLSTFGDSNLSHQ
jgi:hypothetical protein